MIRSFEVTRRLKIILGVLLVGIWLLRSVSSLSIKSMTGLRCLRLITIIELRRNQVKYMTLRTKWFWCIMFINDIVLPKMLVNKIFTINFKRYGKMRRNTLEREL